VRLNRMDQEHRPGGRVVLDAPPVAPDPVAVNPLTRLMPIAMVAAMVGMGAIYLRSGNPVARSPMFLALPVMMLVSVVGMLAQGGRGGARTAEIHVQRATYLRYLDSVDGQLGAAAAEQHRWLYGMHPDPRALWTIAGSDRMWRRTAAHPECLRIRVGVGSVPAATVLEAPQLAAEDRADPVTTDAVHRLLRCRSTVPDVPVTVSLSTVGTLLVTGEVDRCRAVARALVCQLALAHPPDLVGIGVQTGRRSDAWSWLKWLPHSTFEHSPEHRLLIVDGIDPPARQEGATVLHIRAGAAPLNVSVDGREVLAVYDELSMPETLTCARRVARGSARGRCSRRQRPTDWLTMMGIDDPADLDPPAHWGRRPATSLLRVPIGTAEDGALVELDIKEAAAGGVGPHGLCIGATGSGKSEFLRTLVLGMITAHPPDVLNLVLVDFKGGATFLGFERARHVSAIITNLADEAPLVSRMHDALSGEITRRQEALRAAGNLANVADYRRARARDAQLPPLPALFVVVDEFSELLSRHPDFADLFVAVGRLGRSLGVHLLLASQRLDEGRLRGLETHLSYRICLKTFSAADSRAALGVPDAYHLPAQPGAAFLKTAAEQVTRLQTAFVSGDVEPRHTATTVGVRRFTSAASDDSPARSAVSGGQPLLDTVLNRLAGHGTAAHRVWLPPLDRAPALDDLLPAATPLRVPIGIVDCPFEQRYEPLMVDLSGAAGNVAVVGAPQSGKSTTLRTLVSALAACHDPATVQFYCLDFGGGALSTLEHLPHVGCVAGRRDEDLCRRTIAQLEAVLRTREATFRRLGVESIAQYRHRREATDPYGDVFLVVDGWSTVRRDFDSLEADIAALAARGLSYGVHVVLAAARWADLRPALKDQIGSRIELRLGDPAESEIDRKRARELAGAPPGRGLTTKGREMAVALPAARPVRSWPEDLRAPRVELLPSMIRHDRITVGPRRRGQVVLGVGERDLGAIALDVLDQPHLLVLGEGECGKSSLLRTVCTELTRHHTDREVALEIVDYRRALLGVVETDHLAGYSASPVAVAARVAAVAALLTARMPDERVTQQQLRERSWWNGPELFVVVDDYDLVAGAAGNPLTPLADFLPHAKDLGLHVIVARRSGGAARALFDPVLGRLRDIGCSTMLMSAAPDDGALLSATRPGPQPPGRGTLTVRGRPDELVQVGWFDPP